MKHFQNQKQKQRTLSTKTNHAVGKNGHGELDEMGESICRNRGGRRKKKGMEESDAEPESEGEKEGGQNEFGGKVSGPVGVSSRVQPLWLGKEGEEGGEVGTGLGQQKYGVCVD